MKKNYVEMGRYYRSNPYGLVKTVCRGYNYESGEVFIAYVNVNKGGCASDIFLMPENEFQNIFIGLCGNSATG